MRTLGRFLYYALLWAFANFLASFVLILPAALLATWRDSSWPVAVFFVTLGTFAVVTGGEVVHRTRSMTTARASGEDKPVESGGRSATVDLNEVLGWKPGDVLFGRYRVQKIKTGGMSSVYVCSVVREPDSLLAIKVPRLQYGQWLHAPPWIGRNVLAEELSAWSRIGFHPNVVQLIRPKEFAVLVASGDRKEVAVLFLEYGGDSNLLEYCHSTRSLELDGRMRLLRHVCAGMGHAYSRGVTPHLDLKPQNVLVDDGVARVTDFGLARVHQRHEQTPSNTPAERETQTIRTQAGIITGTPAYMAPEQWIGTTRCDERTDIYAFGILAFEILAGRHPFEEHLGRSLKEVRHAHCSIDPPVALLNCDESVRTLVSRCAAKAIESRFQSWSELNQSLGQLHDEKDPALAAGTAKSEIDQVRYALFLDRLDEVRPLLKRPSDELSNSSVYFDARTEDAISQRRPATALGIALGGLLRGCSGSFRRIRHVLTHAPVGFWVLPALVVYVGSLIALSVGMTRSDLPSKTVWLSAFLLTTLLPTVAIVLVVFRSGNCPNCGVRLRRWGTCSRDLSGTWRARVCARCGFFKLWRQRGTDAAIGWLQRVDRTEILGFVLRSLRYRWQRRRPDAMRLGVGLGRRI